MIRYALKCADNHGFDSWFQSAQAYDKLRSAAMIVCPVCGGTVVDKSLMAPAVRQRRGAVRAPSDSGRAATRAADLEATQAALPDNATRDDERMTRMLAALRREVEASADYVGTDFARQARAIHNGEAPERAIYGEARIGEARALLAEGVPVAPLPFLPTRKMN